MRSVLSKTDATSCDNLPTERNQVSNSDPESFFMEFGAGVTFHGGASHKSSIRRLTSARREQNRRAQKNFRARRKARQDHAQKLGEAVPTLATENPRAEASYELDVEQPYDQIHNLGDQKGLHQSKSYVSHVHAAAKAGTIDGWTRSGLVGDPIVGQPLVEQSRPPSTASTVYNQPRILTPLAPAIFFPADPSTVDMRAMWPIPMKCFQEVYSPPHKLISIMQDHPDKTFHSHWDTSQEQTASASRSFSVPSRSSDSQGSKATLPCPHRNYIQLMGESCFAATMAIAAHLGITRSAYINDHPSLFPLSSSDTFGSGLQPSQLEPDLQPTLEQRTLAHPNFLDCIIFSHFRSRAIELSSRAELDLCSLFLDLMHDGLICWGSQSAGRSQARGRLDRDWESMRGGMPWDRRSWEARPWFLRKWSFLVGDDDADGMRSGSEWWQGVRGEIGVHNTEDLGSKEPIFEDQGAIFSRYGGCNVGIRQTVENNLLVVWNGEQWALNKDLL